MAAAKLDESYFPYCDSDVQRENLQAYIDTGCKINQAASVVGRHRRTFGQSIERIRRNALDRGYSPELGLATPTPNNQNLVGLSRYERTENGGQWVILRKKDEDVKKALQAFVDGLTKEVKGLAKPAKKPAKSKLKDDLVLYGIGDAHIGMYAWKEETGADDFDTQIACDQIRSAFDYLVELSPPTETGIFCNVGDWLHANDSTSLTPSNKNKLDTDTRFAYVIPKSAELQKYCIDKMLEKHKKVIVANASGNHDPDASIWVNEITRAYYSNNKRVEVLGNARKFLHFKFGSCLVVITHGDQINQNRLYEAVTRDFRQEMAGCDHVYVITGHIHHKVQQEIGGILFESMNTLAPSDAWHAASGYGGRREMQSIIFDKKAGVKHRNFYNLHL